MRIMYCVLASGPRANSRGLGGRWRVDLERVEEYNTCNVCLEVRERVKELRVT